MPRRGGGECGEPSPLWYDRDVPWTDRSCVCGEVPGDLLPVSSQDRRGKGKRDISADEGREGPLIIEV